MQKWARMFVETGKAFVDPSAMKTQMREDSDLQSLPPLTILFWGMIWFITKHLEDGPGVAQWTTPQPDWLHSSEEALTIRSGQSQNTKLSKSRHWKWPRLADADLPPSPENNQQAQTHKTQVWPRKAERSQCVGTFQAMIGGKFAPLTLMNIEDKAWIQWSPPSTQQSLKHPVRSLANIVRRKKTWVTAEFLDLYERKLDRRTE